MYDPKNFNFVIYCVKISNTLTKYEYNFKLLDKNKKTYKEFKEIAEYYQDVSLNKNKKNAKDSTFQTFS